MKFDLYVGNLAHAATEDEVRKHFEKSGHVEKVKIIMDKLTGRPRGFAFVTMGSAADMESAVSSLDNKEFMGRTLRVNQARPQEPRTGGASHGGGDFRSRGPRRSF